MGIFSKLFTGSPPSAEPVADSSAEAEAAASASTDPVPAHEPPQPFPTAQASESEVPSSLPTAPPASSVNKRIFNPETSPPAPAVPPPLGTTKPKPKPKPPRPATVEPPPPVAAAPSRDEAVPHIPALSKSIPRLSKAARARAETKPAPAPRPPPPVTKPKTLDSEIDDMFDGATVSGPAQAGPGRVTSSASTEDEIRHLFGEIAAHHAAQLRDFLVELTHSPTSTQWAEICSPAMTSIRRAAEGIGHDKLTNSVRRLEKAIDDARRGAATMIEGPVRDKLLSAFAGLADVLPEAFDVASHTARRDPIIVDTLLEQVAGVSTLAKERIYAAGLSSIGAFYGAKASDLAAATGISEAVCTAVIQRFAEYRRARTQDAARADHGAERDALAALLKSLASEHAAYRAAELEEDAAAKRRIRKRRNDIVREINLALAHLGELGLIDEIKRAPIDAKIDRVKGWMRTSKAG